MKPETIAAVRVILRLIGRIAKATLGFIEHEEKLCDKAEQRNKLTVH